MALFFKKHWSKAAKIAGAALFAVLMFVNLQLTTNTKKSGDIDLCGLKIMLTSTSAYAEGGYSCTVHVNCSNGGWVECTGTTSCSKTSTSVTCDGKETMC